jgi:hypothetical protein
MSSRSVSGLPPDRQNPQEATTHVTTAQPDQVGPT